MSIWETYLIQTTTLDKEPKNLHRDLKAPREHLGLWYELCLSVSNSVEIYEVKGSGIKELLDKLLPWLLLISSGLNFETPWQQVKHISGCICQDFSKSFELRRKFAKEVPWSGVLERLKRKRREPKEYQHSFSPRTGHHAVSCALPLDSSYRNGQIPLEAWAENFVSCKSFLPGM